MRLVRDENGFRLVDYTPEQIGAASLENLNALVSYVESNITTIITQLITPEIIREVFKEVIAETVKVSFIVDFEVNERGDIFYRDSDGSVQRLPIGDDGTILTVSNGLPSWQTNMGRPSVIAAAAQQMFANTVYVCTLSTLTTLILPTTATVGNLIRVAGAGSGGWRVTQNQGQRIHFGDKSTTLSTGYIESTHPFDYLTLMCTNKDTVFTVINSVGNPYLE